MWGFTYTFNIVSAVTGV